MLVKCSCCAKTIQGNEEAFLRPVDECWLCVSCYETLEKQGKIKSRNKPCSTCGSINWAFRTVGDMCSECHPSVKGHTGSLIFGKQK
jgi:hypothetical protein